MAAGPGPLSGGAPTVSPGPGRDPLAAARRIAEEVLAPAAERVDQQGVPAGHIAAIRDAGLLGLRGPVEEGGLNASAPVVREVAEILAGADCSTWFVQAQHHSPVAMLAGSTMAVRDRLLGPLTRGELLAGVAFAHLRRYPATPVTATPVGAGYRFDGEAPWFTGWGLNDVVLLGGMGPDAEIVWAFVGVDQPGLFATPPLRLAALSATSTVRLRLEGVSAGPADVVARVPYSRWSTTDRETTVNVNPAVFGITATAVRHLATGPAPAPECAAAMSDELDGVRAHAYRLWDGLPPAEGAAERLAVKARAAALMLRATAALVAAGSGASIALAAPAQRLAREALFLLVQAQTAEVRFATLRQLAGPRA